MISFDEWGFLATTQLNVQREHPVERLLTANSSTITKSQITTTREDITDQEQSKKEDAKIKLRVVYHKEMLLHPDHGTPSKWTSQFF